MYAEAVEVIEFCGLEPETDVGDTLAFAKGFIDSYCGTTFEDPGADAEYLYDGNGSRTLFAPDAGPFHDVTGIAEYTDGAWIAHTSKYWLKADGEWIELTTPTTPGNHNWRVAGRCWKELGDNRGQMLKRATLMICKLSLVARDEPLGPSVRSISTGDGVSYTYTPVNYANPTGVNEVDYILRSLRRSVLAT
jgi:hypothetical protein